jgi:SpoVK/Ycf46/Vps4 family AAA+-type ATPase
MSKADLSGPLTQQLQRTLEEARRQRQAGSYAAAAQAYRRCGQLQIQLAEYAVTKEVKAQQLKVAETYLETAGQMERQGQPQAEPAGGDDLQSQVAALRTRANVTWDDIGNLVETKAALQAAYAFALVRRPAGVEHRPVDKILLYGPSGTGKTMLAAAASNELDAAFYSVKASDLLSKWFGESPRLVSALYREAAAHAPAVIFLEEFDALAPQRGDSDSGAERRIVSTLLAELDGIPLAATQGRYVLTVAATNLPWMIDPAILGRFGARLLYVPLPAADARRQIVEKHLAGRGYQSQVSLHELARRSEGFSGRDLANLCSIAIERMEVENNQDVLQLRSRAALSRYELRITPLTQAHFDYALARITPQAALTDLRRYDEWRRQVER